MFAVLRVKEMENTRKDLKSKSELQKRLEITHMTDNYLCN